MISTTHLHHTLVDGRADFLVRVVCADVIRNFPPKNCAAGCLLSRASQINKQLRMRYRKSSSLRAQVRFVCYGNLVVCYAHVHVKDFHDHIGK